MLKNTLEELDKLIAKKIEMEERKRELKKELENIEKNIKDEEKVINEFLSKNYDEIDGKEINLLDGSKAKLTIEEKEKLDTELLREKYKEAYDNSKKEIKQMRFDKKILQQKYPTIYRHALRKEYKLKIVKL